MTWAAKSDEVRTITRVGLVEHRAHCHAEEALMTRHNDLMMKAGRAKKAKYFEGFLSL